jgi:hypothetical protein
MSPDLFRNELQDMLSINPVEDPDAYDHQHVINGWKRTIEELLKEF